MRKLKKVKDKNGKIKTEQKIVKNNGKERNQSEQRKNKRRGKIKSLSNKFIFKKKRK